MGTVQAKDDGSLDHGGRGKGGKKWLESEYILNMYTYIYIYVYMYTYIHIYTHIYIYIF